MGKDDIINKRPTPEWGLCIFCDGTIAQYWDTWEGKNQTGESITFIVMRPYEKLIKKWGIRMDELDENFCMRPIPYPTSKVNQISSALDNPVILITTDFKGGTTTFDSIFKRKDERIKNLEIENETLNETIAYLRKENKMMSTQFDEQLEKTSKRVEIAGKRMKPTIVTSKSGEIINQPQGGEEQF